MHPMCSLAAEHLVKALLAFGQRQPPQIVCSFKQQVEGEVDEVLGPSLRERRLERCKVGRAVVVESTDLTIDDTVR
jgi:hypothetical protein